VYLTVGHVAREYGLLAILEPSSVSGTIIGYRFALPMSTVSRLPKSAMHELGVKTKAQLVAKMRGLPRADPDNRPA
jgi:hypothetical protein